MPNGKQLDFNPGEYVQVSSAPFKLQYSSLTIDKKFLDSWNRLGIKSLEVGSQEPVTRAYSLANKPEEYNQVVLLIRLALPPPAQQRAVPPGIVSSWLFSCAVGDKVTLSGPYGDFHLRDNDREMILIGGGVGMAPLRSIIHHELQGTRTRLVSFFYGARSQEDLFYQQEFDQLQRDHERFNRTTALSDPDSNSPWHGPVGFIHEVFKAALLDSHPHPERCDYYLCGPPLMQKAVMSVLDDAGVDATHIFADVFGV
jgi:Na+-transporting NADH:ubiquinone oxidoreductase subunit F